MRKILVLYYSQTGQLPEILRSLLAPIEADASFRVVFQELRPVQPFVFPWTVSRFCDVFPESVAGVPCAMRPLPPQGDGDPDLVILAYTVWYLAPSIPIWSFLQSPAASSILRGRPVVTVLGCRNMWLMAQERVKKRLRELGADLAGNVVFRDRAGNLVGVVTMARWMITGRKERFLGVLPAPGVSAADIDGAGRFGESIRRSWSGDRPSIDQAALNGLGAVQVDAGLLLMETRLAGVFRFWSRFIRRRGGPGDPRRRRRLLLFLLYLLTAILVLAPVASLAARLLKRLKRGRLAEEVAYYSGITCRGGHAGA